LLSKTKLVLEGLHGEPFQPLSKTPNTLTSLRLLEDIRKQLSRNSIKSVKTSLLTLNRTSSKELLNTKLKLSSWKWLEITTDTLLRLLLEINLNRSLKRLFQTMT
jgi:hypothetical protein